jgi:hypothetical protein
VPQKKKKDSGYEPGMVIHACNPSTQEVEAGGLRVQVQPELYSKTLSQKQQQKNLVMITCNFPFTHCTDYLQPDISEAFDLPLVLFLNVGRDPLESSVRTLNGLRGSVWPMYGDGIGNT